MSDMIWNGSYTLGNSQETQITAGTGIKVTTPAAGQIQISNDETVIMSTAIIKVGVSQNFLEDPNNFECIDLYIRDRYNNDNMVKRMYRQLSASASEDGYSFPNVGISTPFPYSGNQILTRASALSINRNSITLSSSCQFVIKKTGDNTTAIWADPDAYAYMVLDKVVGVKRR
jgi:hypothetical protein